VIVAGIVLASLGPSAKGGELKCLKCCSCAAIFVLLQRKVLQQVIVAGIVLASLGPSAKGGAQMFKVLQLRCHFFVFIAHSSKLESHETKKIPLRS